MYLTLDNIQQSNEKPTSFLNKFIKTKSEYFSNASGNFVSTISTKLLVYEFC